MDDRLGAAMQRVTPQTVEGPLGAGGAATVRATSSNGNVTVDFRDEMF